jgi:hypothetical protein
VVELGARLEVDHRQIIACGREAALEEAAYRIDRMIHDKAKADFMATLQFTGNNTIAWSDTAATNATLTSYQINSATNAQPYTTMDVTYQIDGTWQSDPLTMDKLDAMTQAFEPRLQDPNRLDVRGPKDIHLPDGTVIALDRNGNFVIQDKDARVKYAANRNRNFNPFVNAGDQAARFIEYVRTIYPALRKKEAGELPLALFIQWLIVEAAERDHDPVPEDVTPLREDRLLQAVVQPRCAYPSCNRFIRKTYVAAGFNYCKLPRPCAVEHQRLLAA